MLVAYDAHGNRVYADEYELGMKCFCPECNEPLKYKHGPIYRPYFAHYTGADCLYDIDGDNKSPWHIHMQELFPKEQREYRFVDSMTGERHYADVFVKEKNTVIEFQKSPIEEMEFCARTEFHLREKRRIIWVFDESKRVCNEGDYGRLKIDKELYGEWPYQELVYKWPRRPRKCLMKGPPIDLKFNSLDNYHFVGTHIQDYCVCVHTGTEGDLVHRIVGQRNQYGIVYLSLHAIEMNKGMDVDEFFVPEMDWGRQDPLKDRIEMERRTNRKQRSRMITESHRWL